MKKPPLLPLDPRALWLVPKLFQGATHKYFQEIKDPPPLKPYDWVQINNATGSLAEQTFQGLQGYILVLKYHYAKVQLTPGAYFFPTEALTCITTSTSTKMPK